MANHGEMRIPVSEILTPKQLAAYELFKDTRTKQILYGGAAGGGKTFLGCFCLFMGCFMHPGSRYLMGRSVLKRLKETTLNTFFDIAAKWDWGRYFTYKEQKGEILFTNGSEILLKDLFAYPSDPNFDALGSLEITGAFIDECNQVTEKAKQIVYSRIRYKLDEFDIIPKLLMTCNPAKNWVYSEFYKPSRDESLPDHKAFVSALVSDNEHIPNVYVDSLRELNQASRERLLYGNWEYDDDPTALIDFEAITDLFENSHVTGDGKKYLTADIALQGSDRFVLMVWDGFKVEQIIEVPKADGKEVVEKIHQVKHKHRIPNSRIVYDADGVGGMAGGWVRGAKAFRNGGRPFRGENYENLKTQCYYALAEKIQGRELWISAQVTPEQRDRLQEELAEIKTRDADKDGKMKLKRKEDIKKDLGRSPDLADALMMRLYFDKSVKLARPV